MKDNATPGRLVVLPGEYQEFKEYLREASGIALGDSKEYLVSSRLSGLMKEHGLSSLGNLLSELRMGRNPRLRTQVIDAMTTNETFWFRDPAHFKFLHQKVLPELAGAGALRIWSAACSSGQEPYTISMQLHDFLMRNPGRFPRGVEIVATDISSRILEEARKGRYSGMAASRGLSDDQRQRYFLSHQDGLEVRPEIRRRISFREFNLTRGYEALGQFDIIFCRNVLIYFTAAVKRDILNRMARVLRPGGYLFLGSTESMTADSGLFEMVAIDGAIVYRLKP